MADQYLLRVTAGPSHDPSTHQLVNVNTPTPTQISSPNADISLAVRIQNYRGLPPTSPSTSAYFSHAPHTSDQYSISFTFTPHRPIAGPSLLFGNDFDSPVRDRLPPGFNAAMRIVKWAVDPGLEGDVYADKPYLFGAALGSMNILRVGGKMKKGEGQEKRKQDGAEGEQQQQEAEDDGNEDDEESHEEIDISAPDHSGTGALEEGAQSPSGLVLRDHAHMPSLSTARQKWAHTASGGRDPATWTWEAHRQYAFDFFNPYLDFNNFSLKLPTGWSMGLSGYLGGNDYLRYVLKEKDTGEVFFVVVFTLLKKEDLDGGLVGEVEGGKGKEEAKGVEGEGDGVKGEGERGQGDEPRADDVD